MVDKILQWKHEPNYNIQVLLKGQQLLIYYWQYSKHCFLLIHKLLPNTQITLWPSNIINYVALCIQVYKNGQRHCYES
jgi:hypothetical protein